MAKKKQDFLKIENNDEFKQSIQNVIVFGACDNICSVGLVLGDFSQVQW